MGRQANTNRNYFIWCLLLTVGGSLITNKYMDVKQNYTDLHNRVNQIEREMKKWTLRMNGLEHR